MTLVKSRSTPAIRSRKPADTGHVSRRPLRPSNSLRTVYRQLDSYQKRGVDFALDVRTAALLFEQGTGKTWIAGGIIEALLSDSFEGLLVVSLANLETTWLAFFEEHLPQLNVYSNFDAFKKGAAPKLFLTHYEGLRKKGLIARIKRRPLVFIGYDESQRLKNRTTLDSRLSAKLRACGEYRVILTGTPMDENPAEMWAQFRFLREDVFGDKWSDFEDVYFEPLTDKQQAMRDHLDEVSPGTARWRMLMMQYGRSVGKRQFDMDMLDEFLDLAAPYSMRVTKEVLNLPPMRTHKVPLELEGEQRDLYETISSDLVARLGNSKITTPMRVTQLGRLHQICGGYVPDDDGNVHEVGRVKQDRVLRLARRIAKPFVIFCKYRTEIQELVAELSDAGYRVAEIHGGIKKKLRPAIVRDFQRARYDVIVVQERTGGVGIDLFKATAVIIYSLTYSRIDFEQALARVHRRGQEFPVDVYLLFIAGTVDEDVFEAILAKDRITRKVLIELEQKRSQSWRRIPRARPARPTPRIPTMSTSTASPTSRTSWASSRRRFASSSAARTSRS